MPERRAHRLPPSGIFRNQKTDESCSREPLMTFWTFHADILRGRGHQPAPRRRQSAAKALKKAPALGEHRPKAACELSAAGLFWSASAPGSGLPSARGVRLFVTPSQCLREKNIHFPLAHMKKVCYSSIVVVAKKALTTNHCSKNQNRCNAKFPVGNRGLWRVSMAAFKSRM